MPNVMTLSLTVWLRFVVLRVLIDYNYAGHEA